MENELLHLLQRWQINETFGIFAEIAYGADPLLGIDHILGLYFPLEIELPGADIRLQETYEASRFFASILGQLVTKLDLIELVDILGKKDDEIRAVARAILDEESGRHYGRPFGEVVPIPELRQILDQGREYLAAMQ